MAKPGKLLQALRRTFQAEADVEEERLGDQGLIRLLKEDPAKFMVLLQKEEAAFREQQEREMGGDEDEGEKVEVADEGTERLLERLGYTLAQLREMVKGEVNLPAGHVNEE